MFAGQQGVGGAPALIAAMSSPDRLVRFESAFAVAAALPQQQFAGQDRVVPLLAEAMSQTGVPSVLVVMPTQDRANATVERAEAGRLRRGRRDQRRAGGRGLEPAPGGRRHPHLRRARPATGRSVARAGGAEREARGVGEGRRRPQRRVALHRPRDQRAVREAQDP